MIRRLPLIPTLVVALAAATMIALGVWQLGRAREKEALLDRYRAVQGLPAVDLADVTGNALPLFRRAAATCEPRGDRRVMAGRNLMGEVGYVHVLACAPIAGRRPWSVELGWSRDPNAAFRWTGGRLSGVVAPDSRSGMRLVADAPPEGLQASAPPSIESIPNNHRSYAVQWFLFAGLSVLIYVLALRGRLAARAAVANDGARLP